jgi:hypothetical protein
MHLSGHIAQDLETRGPDEGYLALPNEFQQVVRTMESLDGNYLLEYSSCGVIIRSGSAEMGLHSSYDQHVQASKLSNPKTKTWNLCRSYPHELVALNISNQKGVFQSLNQLVGIAFDRPKVKDLVDLFEWNATELKELEQLTGAGGQDSILEKKYKHIVMMVEIAHGIAIVPHQSPG